MSPKTEDTVVEYGPGCLWTPFATSQLASARQSAEAAENRNANAITARPAPAAQNGGGSFWSIFEQVGFEASNPMETLLDQQDCSLEALLGVDELLQELRMQNKRLINRLCMPDAIEGLIDFVTRQPSSSSSTPSSYEFGLPFIASQILSSDTPELLSAWMGSPELMERFWRYVEVTPPDKIDSVLSGYFSSTSTALVERHPVEVANFLRKRGATEYLDLLLERLHARSIAELLAALACAEEPDRVVFDTETLTRRLLDLLHDPTTSEEGQEHAATVLGELLCRGGSICFASELLILMTSKDVVDPLIELILHGEHRRATAAATVLANAVFQASGGAGGVDPNLSKTLSTVPLSPLSNNGGSPSLKEALDNINGTDDLQDLPAVHTDSSAKSLPVAVPPVCCEGLVATVASHFDGVRDLLEGALEGGLVGPGAKSATRRDEAKASGPAKTWGLAPKPVVLLGNVLEVILLLTLLVRANRQTALQAMQHAALLPLCFKVLLNHPWSSLLHNAVCSLFSEVLCVADECGTEVFLAFSSPGDILEMIVKEFKQQGDRRKSSVGYMGQLHILCNDLLYFAKQGTPDRQSMCADVFSAVPGWKDSVLPLVDSVANAQSEELGGGVPIHIRALAAAHAGNTMMGTPLLDDGREHFDDFLEEAPKWEEPPAQIDLSSSEVAGEGQTGLSGLRAEGSRSPPFLAGAEVADAVPPDPRFQSAAQRQPQPMQPLSQQQQQQQQQQEPSPSPSPPSSLSAAALVGSPADPSVAAPTTPPGGENGAGEGPLAGTILSPDKDNLAADDVKVGWGLDDPNALIDVDSPKGTEKNSLEIAGATTAAAGGGGGGGGGAGATLGQGGEGGGGGAAGKPGQKQKCCCAIA